jgi:adenylate cyclase
VLNFRPEYHADWMQKSYYRQMPIAPLGPEAIRELLDDLLGSDTSVTGLAERIHERTAGNPFFTEEVIQALIEAGNLEGVRGRYRLVTPVGELRIPGTVQSILAARIDRLIERAKQVLHTAAVIGKEFAEPILEEVAELPRSDLASALETLKGGEFIYEQSLYPVAEYAFKHPLTQEVALHSQLKDRRRQVHAQVARAIEASSGDKLDEQAALLAHHWEEAGEALPAARWHWRASAWAGASHSDEMLRHLESARQLLRDVPESDEILALRTDALGALLTQGVRLGLPPEKVSGYLAEGEELLARTDDARARIPLLQGQGTFLAYTGRPVVGCSLVREAIELADALDDADLQIGSRLVMMVPMFPSGPAPDAAEIAREALARLADAATPRMHVLGYDTESAIRSFRAMFLTRAARHGDALREVELSRDRARDLDDSFALAFSLAMSSMAVSTAGDLDQGVAYGRRAVEVAQAGATSNLVSISAAMYARTLALAEKWQEAYEISSLGFEVSGSLGILRLLMGSPHALALLGLGRLDEALAAARTAADLSREAEADLAEPDDLRTLARVLCETEGAAARDEIESALARAAELSAATGASSNEPWLHVERARLAGVLGDAGARQRELTEAARLFREQGALPFAERTERDPGL